MTEMDSVTTATTSHGTPDPGRPPSFNDVLLSVDDGVASLEINRPERRNSLSLATLEQLCAALDWVQDCDDVAATVLSGAGGHFCSGYHLDVESHLGLTDERFSTARDHARLQAMRTHLLRIRRHPKPIVTRIEGFCLAGGTDLLICSDVSVAANSARFGVPNVRALGISFLIPMWVEAIGPARAKLLAMTGDQISGRIAADWGLVSLAVPAEDVSETAMALARRIAAAPIDVMVPNKAALTLGSEMSGFENRSYAAMHLDVIAHGGPAAHGFWTGVQEEGLRATLRNRDAAFPGSLVEELVDQPQD